MFLAFVLIAGILTPAASAQTFAEDLPRPVLPDGIPEANMPPVPDQQSNEEIILAEEDHLLSDADTFSGPEEGAPGELIISVQERDVQGTAARTWDVAVEGGTAPYFYQFYMVLPTYINGKWISYSEGQQLYSANNSFSFAFRYDGAYQLWVYVRDSGGRNTRYIHHVDVEGVGVQPQLNCEADFPMLTLPAPLKTVEAEAFRGDTSLRYAIIPEGTTTIGNGAFADCRGLWMALVPGSVTSIAPDAFDTNNPHLTLLVLQDSPAHVYAADHGIRFQVIPE